MGVMETDSRFMAAALAEAARALEAGDVPVGAVVVLDGAVIAGGFNSKEALADPTAHAEVVAIRGAAAKLKRWRLTDATLYVTLEPCLMCMGAIIQARLTRLVFGAFDPKAGACGSLYDVSNDERLNHSVEVTPDVLASESGEMLKSFFSGLRTV